MSTVTQSIRRIVKQLVKDHGLRACAGEIDIDPGHLSRWVRGQRSVSTDVLDRIATWAGVEIGIKIES